MRFQAIITHLNRFRSFRFKNQKKGKPGTRKIPLRAGERRRTAHGYKTKNAHLRELSRRHLRRMHPWWHCAWREMRGHVHPRRPARAWEIRSSASIHQRQLVNDTLPLLFSFLSDFKRGDPSTIQLCNARHIQSEKRRKGEKPMHPFLSSRFTVAFPSFFPSVLD